MIDSQLLLEDLLITMLALIYSMSIVILSKYLKEKRKISSYTARKLIHTFSALSLFITPYLNYPWFSVLIGISMVILTLISKRESKIKMGRELYEAIHEEKEEKLGYLQGPFLFCLAVTILMTVFLFIPGRWYFPIGSLLIMMYSDTLASIVGKKYGKHQILIPWVRKPRTLEGSLSFLISAFLISMITFHLIGVCYIGFNIPLETSTIVMYCIIMSITATILELLSPSNYDDFIIPIGTTLIIIIIFNIMG